MRKILTVLLMSVFMIGVIGCTPEDTEPKIECGANEELVDGVCEYKTVSCAPGWVAYQGTCVEEQYVYEGTSVVLNGSQLIVEGVPFYMKGVCWNPVVKGGTHPTGLDYIGTVEADALLMKEAGINVVRTYDAITDTDVLDVLYENGIYVINTIYNYGGSSATTAAANVNAVKDHPAILMWAIGNEWNYNGLYYDMTFEEAKDKINEVAELIQSIDIYHPVSTVYGHIPSGETINDMPDIDIWGLNMYSGLTFGNVFDTWKVRSYKPMFMAEYGADAWNANTGRVDLEAQAEATRILTELIMANSSAADANNVSIGGTIFEFNDEWWKDGNGSLDTHDSGGSAPGSGPHPDNTFNEEYWGIVDIDRNPRPAYFALQELFTEDE